MTRPFPWAASRRPFPSWAGRPRIAVATSRLLHSQLSGQESQGKRVSRRARKPRIRGRRPGKSPPNCALVTPRSPKQPATITSRPAFRCGRRPVPGCTQLFGWQLSGSPRLRDTCVQTSPKSTNSRSPGWQTASKQRLRDPAATQEAGDDHLATHLGRRRRANLGHLQLFGWHLLCTSQPAPLAGGTSPERYSSTTLFGNFFSGDRELSWPCGCCGGWLLSHGRTSAGIANASR